MANGELILYATDDGVAKIHFRTVDGTVWLTQAEIAELFDTSKQNISWHIKNVLPEVDIALDSVVKEHLTTAADGKSYMTKYYNLDVIFAVGYRVQSPRGTQFRQWATTILKEYGVKGFVIYDEMLKNPDWDYFDELLERIREIRASEARFYRKVRDLLALSEDYNPDSNIANSFYARIQNKMLHSVTGSTAAELIVTRANPELPNMSLTSWKGARVRKEDIGIRKNFLSVDEISDLNHIVTMFLDTAELRARRRQTTKLAIWDKVLDNFLSNNELHVLRDSGRISADDARQIVNQRYISFDQKRKEAERASDVDDDVIEELKRIAESVQRKNKGTNDV